MTIPPQEAESLLAVDIGTIHTRASLFDVVEGQYRYIATGMAHSTTNAPYRDASEGIHRALILLQQISGRWLLDENGTLVLPVTADGTGVDRFVVTYSAGANMRLALLGLLPDVSLDSLERLAATISANVVEVISLNDRRSTDMQLDGLIKARPDLILLAGGTENGANRSVLRLAELVLMLCRVLPAEQRPHLFYGGNHALATKIKETLEKYTSVQLSPNIRPGVQEKNPILAQEALGRALIKARSAHVGGLEAIARYCSAIPMPSSHALGRMVRFLSRLYEGDRGVMAVDVGASGVTVAASLAGDLELNVFPGGLGCPLSRQSIEDISAWLPFAIPEDVISDTLQQKNIFPTSLPMTAEALAIEQAIARLALRSAVLQTHNRRPEWGTSFEPYLASGAVFANTAHPSQALLMLLDAIQPVGITMMMLDPNNLLAGIGAAARVNQVLPVQALESGAFLNLGTIIAPLSNERPGRPVLRVRLEFEDGSDTRLEIKQGTLTPLPLLNGQNARIQIEALHNTIIDPYNRRRVTNFKICGGVCGAVVDTRGRPLVLPTDPVRRQEILTKWASLLP